MKKIIYTKIVSLLILAITVIGCSDEFLEQTNPNSLSTGTFWQNMDDLNMGLIGAYKSFSSPNNILLVDDILRSDLAWGSGYQRPTNTNVYYLQTFNDAADFPNKVWAQNYKTIFGANQVIVATEKLLESTFTTATEIEEATKILAQARFIRGYMYFLLHHAFNNGDVPLFDFVPEKESDYFQPISPGEEVRAFLLADLEFAAENLPNSWDANEEGRVTAGAAVALIGQTYLYQNQFDLAAPYFKSVIEDFDYALTSNVGSNFTSMDELNEESILEVVYSMDYKNELGQWDSRDVANTAYNKKLTGGPGSWRGAIPANWLIVEYRNDPIDTSDPRNKVTEEDGTERFRKFSLRTSYSIALVDDEDLGYYGFDTPGQVSPFNVNLTSFWRKHTNWDLGFGSEDLMSPGKVRSPINERLIRLGEIYLQYAECMIETGDLDEALKYINRIRRRAGVVLLGAAGTGEYPANDHDDVTYTAETLMEHLRFKEYPLELSCEGDNNRNIDLRRWGVKKERFQELSERRYDVLHYDVTMPLPEANVVTRWSSIMVEVDPSDPEVDNNLNEFVKAAANYTDDKAYWPIPNSEIIANPKLYE
ncbi:RagB/SusD family nutrient uptake outer membrane protein [Wenyingzhuangia sp. 1_MG-2023]|nr:RagB/SusD family nutrient uptake outer membrane protein [Wenyingzhuangia sp. 1_MG-2023]